MTVKLLGGDKILLEQEYYSVGGGFIEWKGYSRPRRTRPNIRIETISRCSKHTKRDNISIAQLAMANETAISGRSEAEIDAFLDKIIGAMRATVKTGLAAPTAILPGPIKLKTKAGDVYRSAMTETSARKRGIGLVSAAALAGSEENARGHLVITAPDRRLGRGDAGGDLFARHGGREAAQARSFARACWPGRWSAICASTTPRWRRPRAAARPRSESPRRWARR